MHQLLFLYRFSINIHIVIFIGLCIWENIFSGHLHISDLQTCSHFVEFIVAVVDVVIVLLLLVLFLFAYL